MLAVDITAFGSRDPGTQQHLRDGLYSIVERACDAAGLPWPGCHHEDRGDGILVIAPPDISAEILDPAAAYVRAELRHHNERASATSQIQLRMAAHAGYVRGDRDGVSGDDLIHLFRLLEAQKFKDRFAGGHTEFGLITSGFLYDRVLRYAPVLLDRGGYRRITVKSKETRTAAWVWLPGTPDGLQE
jgi:hypothetical protein